MPASANFSSINTRATRARDDLTSFITQSNSRDRRHCQGTTATSLVNLLGWRGGCWLYHARYRLVAARAGSMRLNIRRGERGRDKKTGNRDAVSTNKPRATKTRLPTKA